jgi:serine/threonine protein kinase
MSILHRNGILHRDLMRDNILLNESFELKVADFGLSKFVDVDKPMSQTNDIGTPAYMAPELLAGEPYNGSVDVYAYGILVYTTITKRIPYGGKGLTSIALGIQVIKGVRPDIPSDVPVRWQRLIEGCWSGDPRSRPGWDYICQRLRSIEFHRSFDKSARSRFIEYRDRVSPPDFRSVDATD